MAPKNSASLRFSDHVDVQVFEADYGRKRRKSSRDIMSKVISEFKGEQVTEAMLKNAAKLFSENYGIWGRNGAGKPGTRVKMNAARLRAQCIPEGSKSTYVTVTVDGILAGHAFACRWEYAGRQICWVTQLVVHSEYRERKIATNLLLNLINDDDDVLGIMSSHPAACRALAKAVGNIRFSDIPMNFAQDHAAGVLKASPIDYIKDAKLRGSLYHPHDNSGMVSGVDSNFYVDHDEPLEALAWFKEDEDWPLGELPDGHEFLFLMERSRRRRSRSASSRGSGKMSGKSETSQDAS